jgi:hypothetical protein
MNYEELAFVLVPFVFALAMMVPIVVFDVKWALLVRKVKIRGNK